jgi:aromatic-L-amino-acid decarboxylase
MLWRTSPSATELEQVSLDWLRQLLGLGPGWFGIINDTASISTLLALAAAREAKAALDIRERGMAGRTDLPVLRVYCSEHAHSSVDKAAITLGFGHQNVVKIGVDAEYRMRVDLLEAAIEADRARGYLPVAVVATIGTTSTTSVDPVALIAEVCWAADAWLHVDASYGGVAAVVPEPEKNRFFCPCHEGAFDLETGRPIAGPPQRPLPRVTLEIRDGVVYATGVELRTI